MSSADEGGESGPSSAIPGGSSGQREGSNEESKAAIERSKAARKTLARVAFLPGWAILSAMTVAFALGASVPPRYRWIPLAASVVVLGLPHGAVDHLMLPRAKGDRPDRTWLVVVGVVYAVLGGLYAIAWFTAPMAAFGGFIALTWFHWGTGELYPLASLAGVEHLGTRGMRAATAAVRGAIPMGLPLVAFPDRFSTVAELLVRPFAGGTGGAGGAAGATGSAESAGSVGAAGAALEPFLRADARAAILVCICGLAAWTLAVGGVRARRMDTVRGWVLDAGETALLVAFFGLVPPVLAVGTYFCVWHSLRHVVRATALDARSTPSLSAGRIAPALRRFARDAAPLSAGGLLLLGGIVVAVPRSPGTPVELIGVYLVTVATLTLPHAAIVAGLDREQGLL
jgi:Brp/Blh family beta-carotene 15,15'-monooxygenase